MFSIVHRLDKCTTGVLIIAKNQQTLRNLSSMFEHHEIRKTYIGVTAGVPQPATGEVNAPIDMRSRYVRYYSCLF